LIEKETLEKRFDPNGDVDLRRLVQGVAVKITLNGEL